MDFDDFAAASAGSPTYVYVELANHVTQMIESGALRPGVRLPNESELARRTGVALQTVRRTIRLLQQRGLVVVMRGKGSYIAERHDQDVATEALNDDEFTGHSEYVDAAQRRRWKRNQSQLLRTELQNAIEHLDSACVVLRGVRDWAEQLSDAES